MYQTIILAVDGSESSKRALDEAVRIATFTHGQLHALYLIEKAPVFPYTCHYDMATMKQNLRREGLAMLGEAARVMAAAGVHGDTDLIEIDSMTDDIADCLRRHARRNGADLVVMGTHGHRGFRRAVLGSVAERFLRLSTCPVLLVREQQADADSVGSPSESARSGR